MSAYAIVPILSFCLLKTECRINKPAANQKNGKRNERHLSFTLQHSLCRTLLIKYTGPGMGKLISLCRDEMELEKCKPSKGHEWRAREFFFFITAWPVLCQAFFFHSQRTQMSFCFPYLWYLALLSLILALVIMTTTTGFKSQERLIFSLQSRAFLGGGIWTETWMAGVRYRYVVHDDVLLTDSKTVETTCSTAWKRLQRNHREKVANVSL